MLNVSRLKEKNRKKNVGRLPLKRAERLDTLFVSID